MKIVSIATSKKKGTPKTVVDAVLLVEGHGIAGDAHAGDWHRQISFLSSESIEAAQKRGLMVDFGDFAENFATSGIDWSTVQIGDRFRLGDSALVEVTQIGKECHSGCAVMKRTGECIMPREGIFARVLAGGSIRKGDPMFSVARSPEGEA